MSYDLTIGEFEVTQCPEDRYARAGARQRHEATAPINSSDDQSNTCSPGYLQWREFAAGVGLGDVFYGAAWKHGEEEFEAILHRHPGAVALTQEMLDRFQQAKEAYYSRPVAEQDEYDRKRLDWLVWWSEWALKNCTYPTFANR